MSTVLFLLENNVTKLILKNFSSVPCRHPMIFIQFVKELSQSQRALFRDYFLKVVKNAHVRLRSKIYPKLKFFKAFT